MIVDSRGKICPEKVLPLDTLQDLLQEHHSGQKIVYCHGVFDLLHIGHLRHLRQAKAQGDLLVVGITPDKFVDKGPDRPAFNQDLRAEALACLACVDFVFINQWPTAVEPLKKLRPHIYAKGAEFKDLVDRTGKINQEYQIAQQLGIQVLFTEDIVFSSSNLINRFFSSLPPATQDYLSNFRQRWPLEKVLETLDSMAKLKVLVIGDSIIDDYQYCDPLGKSSKDPVLAVKIKSNQVFAGGILAIANHVNNLAGEVSLFSVLGTKDSYLGLIEQSLSPAIKKSFFWKQDAPTLVKRRFIDQYSLGKLFETYIMDDSGLDAAEETKLTNSLLQEIKEVDLVLAGDFGHGAISDQVAKLLAREAGYLAINTQANAGNRGFHTFRRYPRADLVCIAEHEIRLELRQANGNYQKELVRLGQEMDTQNFIVTQGKKGSLLWNRKKGLFPAPALASKVTDRIGAGDAFLAVSALASVLDVHPELIAFLGNVSGALAVQFMGNEKSITKRALEKAVTALLK